MVENGPISEFYALRTLTYNTGTIITFFLLSSCTTIPNFVEIEVIFWG